MGQWSACREIEFPKGLRVCWMCGRPAGSIGGAWSTKWLSLGRGRQRRRKSRRRRRRRSGAGLREAAGQVGRGADWSGDLHF